MENRLEDLRTNRDLKKNEIAKIIGITPSIYCEWENDRLAIPTKRLYKLAEFFEIPEFDSFKEKKLETLEKI